MNKWLKIILIIIGVVFVVFIVVPFMIGLLATVNPQESIEKGKCVANCQDNNLSQDCMQYCSSPH